MTEQPDFRHPTRREHFVYRVFDAADQLLYVGCTMRPERRWSEHRSERPEVYNAARRFRLTGPYNYDVARRLETQALATESPRFGMTPARRSAHGRNWRLTNKFLTQYLNEGHDLATAGRLAVERAHRECPIERWSA